MQKLRLLLLLLFASITVIYANAAHHKIRGHGRSDYAAARAGLGSVCGDGTVSGDEGCDDGDLSSGDGCSSLCVVESNWDCTGSAPSVCTPYAQLAELYGQSNMIVSSATPVLGVDGGVNGRIVRDGGAIIQLVESGQESPAHGFANWMTGATSGAVAVVDNAAVSGQTYAQLASGTANFTNAQYAAAEVNARHVGSELPLLLWQQGEQNCATSAATYDSNLDTLQSDWQSAYNTRNSTAYSIPVLYGQVGNWPWACTGAAGIQSTVAIGQLTAYQSNTLLDLIGPTYQLSYQNSGASVHLDNAGARRLGTYYGKASRSRFHLGTRFMPLRLDQCDAVSNAITCTVTGGDGSNLASDTVNMRERHNGGFRYTDGTGAPAAITSYSVNAAARTITINLNKEAAGSGIVEYGLNAGYLARLGGCSTCNGPGGNIRDSDATSDQHTAVPLYNFLLVDSHALDSYTSGSATAPSWANTQSFRFASNAYQSTPYMNYLDGRTAWTLTFWIRRDSSWCSSENSLFARGGSNMNQIDIRCNSSGRLREYIATNLTSYAFFDTASSTFSGSTWYFVAIVYDGGQGTANNRLLTYVNASDVSGSGTYTGTMPTAMTTPTSPIEFAMGQTSNTGNSFTSGNIRDVAIWSTALSSSDITDLYSSGTPEDPSGDLASPPVHLWRGEGDSADYGSTATFHMTRWGGMGFTSAHP